GEFIAARIYVPPLLISVIFGALNGFLGSICLAYKDGKSMGTATGIGAAVNIVLNFFGIRMFGMMGAAVATMISYFTMFIIAFFKTRVHVKLRVNLKKDLAAYMLLAAEALIAVREIPMYYFYNAAITAMLLLTYGKEIRTVLREKFRRF
ncbi:MAG: polysaccharide biosynthesis C-terminal domain-containing protein, partial [Lachnospiraceae bacterium]|nr:polysaccharide biosynthesis C-terminal domain-containing protein [Lachnospiraceae bacterium]